MAHAVYLALPAIVIPAPTLANRQHLPSYARAISNLLQVGGAAAFTNISIRIPISDPLELIGQGPSSSASTTPTTATHPGNTDFGPNGTSEFGTGGSSNAHKRISSLSTRPASVHHASAVAGLMPNGVPSGMRSASGASAVSATSSIMSARSAVPGGAPSGAFGDPSSTWEMWDTIRSMCGYHPRLSVTLDLTNPLPPSVGALARWIAEPVKHVWLPGTSFIPNAKGYPVLSKACQAFIKGIAKVCRPGMAPATAY